MIIRSEIFYYDCLDKACEIARRLKGYVDVENAKKENPHIDMSQFHQVIFVFNNGFDCELEVKKYENELKNKKVYIIHDGILSLKCKYTIFNLQEIDIESITFLINNNWIESN